MINLFGCRRHDTIIFCIAAFIVGMLASLFLPCAAVIVISLLLCGVIFFIICFPLSMIASHWEKKLKQKDIQPVKVRKKPDDITDAELDEIIREKGGEH